MTVLPTGSVRGEMVQRTWCDVRVSTQAGRQPRHIPRRRLKGRGHRRRASRSPEQAVRRPDRPEPTNCPPGSIDQVPAQCPIGQSSTAMPRARPRGIPTAR